jgi:hypothetical protein
VRTGTDHALLVHGASSERIGEISFAGSAVTCVYRDLNVEATILSSAVRAPSCPRIEGCARWAA